MEIIAINYEWLLTVVSVMAVGKIEKTGKIEIYRLMKALKALKCEVTKQEIIEMGKILNCFDTGSLTMIYYYDLLKPIKMLLSPPTKEEQEHGVEEEKEGKKNPEIPGANEPLESAKEGEENKGELPLDSPQEEAKMELEEALPVLPESWCNGDFKIVINRCHDCNKHEEYSRHSEETFIMAFNTVGLELKKVFSNVAIFGNYDKITYLEAFDVYIRGVGPSNELDSTGRYMIFSKAIEKRMPTPQEIVDKIIILAFTYGDSIKMAEAQAQFLRVHSQEIPRPYRTPDKHPMPIPESATKKSPKKRMEQEDVNKTCLHWACGLTYQEKDNHKPTCRYHPGKFEFGSIKGWWPEGWSCCRRAWESEGCQLGLHSGVITDEQILFCINHGEIAPNKTYPDSFCGGSFTAKNSDGCTYHSGYLKNGGIWSCCGSKIVIFNF